MQIRLHRDVTCKDPFGLHLPAAAGLAWLAKCFLSRLTIEFHGTQADAGNLNDVLGLHMLRGDRARVHAEGPDAEQAMRAVLALPVFADAARTPPLQTAGLHGLDIA
jgi:phosphotransferase system HPr (HPr) family protein